MSKPTSPGIGVVDDPAVESRALRRVGLHRRVAREPLAVARPSRATPATSCQPRFRSFCSTTAGMNSSSSRLIAARSGLTVPSVSAKGAVADGRASECERRMTRTRLLVIRAVRTSTGCRESCARAGRFAYTCASHVRDHQRRRHALAASSGRGASSFGLFFLRSQGAWRVQYQQSQYVILRRSSPAGRALRPPPPRGAEQRHASRWSAASASRSSARTARGSRRSSACSRRCSCRTAARRASSATTCSRRRGRCGGSSTACRSRRASSRR